MKTFKYRRRGTIPFELEVTDEDGKATKEQFDAITDLEPADLLVVQEIATEIERTTDPAGKVKLSGDMLTKFFGAALTKDDHERLIGLVGSKSTLIQMQTLVDIMTWLIEEYTGRPTEQPSPS